jgi:hypothetical protein
MTSIRPAIASDVAAIVRVADDDHPADGPGAGDADDDPALVARGKKGALLDNRAVVGTAVSGAARGSLAAPHRGGGAGIGAAVMGGV